MTRRLYAFSIAAVKEIGTQGKIIGKPGVCFANSEDEARGIAYKKCKKEFPSEDGWHSQGACVMMIPDDYVLHAAENILEEHNDPSTPPTT